MFGKEYQGSEWEVSVSETKNAWARRGQGTSQTIHHLSVPQWEESGEILPVAAGQVESSVATGEMEMRTCWLCNTVPCLPTK